MSTRLFRMFRWASAAGLASVLFGTLGTTSGCSSDTTPAAGTGGASAGGGSGSGGGGASGSTSGGASGAGGGGGACASPGAPATSPVDHHCEADSGPIVQATGVCVSGTGDAAAGGTADGGGEEPLPGPWGGTSASDDDCKYDVSYTFTSICENQDVTFTVTLKSRSTKKAATGAVPSLEVLDPNGIPAAEGGQAVTEKSNGVYDISKIRFNKKGKWTVRFHFFETCSDTPADSPHGHAAFFINVP